MTEAGFFDESWLNESGRPGTGGDTTARTAAGIVGTGLNAEAIDRMNNGAREMLDSVKSGGFQITERGVDPLLKAVRNARDRFGGLQMTLQILTRNPPLGSSPYAHQVASHVRQSADGPKGIVPVIDALLETLKNLEEALLRASGQYREAETNATASWTQD
ncbi:hypothetical protein [Saccharomonospora iraqiensis]|uniref:hypothetical protein n=1 Tax=Saccharomonospora iraqiensis TaxID=52698 RepID=UPI00022E3F60|nr:hypothetical protein [Saccharomonospora iraqiensis]